MINESNNSSQKQQATYLIVASVVIVTLLVVLIVVFVSKNKTQSGTPMVKPDVTVQATVSPTPFASNEVTPSVIQSATPVITLTPSTSPSPMPVTQYLDVQLRSMNEDMGDGVAYYSFQSCQDSSCKVYLLSHAATNSPMIVDVDNKDFKISATYTFKGITAGSSYYIMSGSIKILKKVQYKRLAAEDGQPKSYIFEVSSSANSNTVRYFVPESLGSSTNGIKNLTAGQWVYLSGVTEKEGAAAGTRYVTLKGTIEAQ